MAGLQGQINRRWVISTFGGGEAPIDTRVEEQSFGIGNFIVYTCPAGRYSEVTINVSSGAAVGIPNRVSITNTSGTEMGVIASSPVGTGLGVANLTVKLGAGQRILIYSVGPITTSFFIKEFADV